MSTDLAWQHRDSLQGGPDDGQPSSTSSSSVQEWDPTAFLNPSMFSSDLVASPSNAAPPQNMSHFQLDHQALGHPQVHQHLSQQHNGAPQQAGNHSFGQDTFQDAYMHDPYAQQSFNEIYNQSQAGRPPFENGRYRSSSTQQPSDLEPPMAQLGLNQEFMYSAPSVSFQQAQAHHQQLGQGIQGHPFDFHQTPSISPNDRASPLPRASPFAISPASNHSFAAQQDFSGPIERRPSTADSAHSLHGEYSGDYGMAAAMYPGGDMGRPMNGNGTNGTGPAGVVPSALHQLQRSNSASFHPHLSQDQGASRAYAPLVPQSSGPPQPNGSFVPSQAAYASHQPSQYLPEANFHIAPRALDAEAPAYQPLNSASPEITRYLRPVLQQYMDTRNRIGFGERTVIVMASKVAQKSYGQERRFLCPPPTAIMIGNAWWTESALGRDDRRAPRVTISISGESTPPESTVEWTSTSGKPVEFNEAPPEPSPFIQEDISNFQNGAQINPPQQTYIGRAVGKQLFISDERQKKVEALVKIVAQGTEDEPERVIGVFPSKPIKVISKPSKKRQSAKNMELCINHGSTVSLFHRLRAQTVSTKYLCVSGSGYSFKGSDGAPLPGVDTPHRGNTPSFVAKIGTWDPFVIYIVDVTKPQGPDTVPPHPLQPDYPAPPPNAIGIMHHGTHIPIYYNQTVVLQCLTSGVVSPVLIIRKVERDTTVVGGGLQEGAKGVPDHFCAPGEVCGDPVSQLHKVAFEVFDPNKGGPAPGSAGATGAFLSCMGDKINTYRPSEGRQWNSSEMSSRSQSPAVPDSPTASSNGSVTDYFSSGSPVDSSSLDGHGASGLPASSDGGRVNSRRGTKRSNTTNSGPVIKGTSKARRRVNSVGSNGSAGGGYVSSSARYGLSEQSMSSGALWSIDIGESAVWTIVGTEQIRYNFYVPPNMPGARASGVPLKPVTPFPNIVKYLPPDRAAENPNKHGGVNRMLVNNGMKPDPRNGPLLTIYGENFSKTDPPLVFFGTEPSPFVDVRCQEVLACLPPPGVTANGGGIAAVDQPIKMEGGAPMPQPIFIARSDGVIYPSNVVFYGK